MRLVFILLAGLVVCGCNTLSGKDDRRSPQATNFVYDDLDRFAAALRAIDSGASASEALDRYVASGTPPFPFYRERYDASGESIAKALARRPKHYHRIAGLKPYLQSLEPTIARGVGRLQQLLPGYDAPPIFYLVGNMTAGGIHARLTPALEGHASAPAVLLEAVSMSPETDMSEFPGNYSGGYLADVPYVAIHEMVHAFQAKMMGLDNYISIYRPGPSNTYLANAIREGCADYVTYLAIGKRRTGNQQEYGSAHERELWTSFEAVMEKPLSFEDGWFGGLDRRTPDWPPQIGYWVGMRMCRAYHEDSPDKARAMRDIFGAYRAEDFGKFADAYRRRLSN